MKKATLVLEGGAVRGVFTSGVLDYLMERDLYLSHTIGVSAGSCNGICYVSRQPGRARECTIQTNKENSYHHGVRQFIKEKSILNMDMLFDRYPNELYPFDYDTYFSSEMECEVVVTNCVTGQAEYKKERSDRERLMRMCRASSSMPLVSPMVDIDGIPYLDGGLSDSVPIQRALDNGNDKIVLILTRNPGYRKKMTSKSMAQIYRNAYKKYPNLTRATIRRNFEYNKAMVQVRQLEAEGKLFVLRPLKPTVSRLEQDCDALMNFYEHGYDLMKQEYTSLQAYLEL